MKESRPSGLTAEGGGTGICAKYVLMAASSVVEILCCIIIICKYVYAYMLYVVLRSKRLKLRKQRKIEDKQYIKGHGAERGGEKSEETRTRDRRK